MITPNDIADRLEMLIGELFPGEKVHRDRVQVDFERPCNLVIYDGGKVNPGYGSNAVEMLDQFTLTTFVEVDEYYDSHLAQLHTRQMKIVGLLVPGYVKVKDRAPKVVAIERGGGYDYDSITVKFSYTLDRNDFMNIEQRPKMETLHLNEEVRTYG